MSDDQFPTPPRGRICGVKFWKTVSAVTAILAVAAPLYCNGRLKTQELEVKQRIAAQENAERALDRKSKENLALAQEKSAAEQHAKQNAEERDNCKATFKEYKFCNETGKGSVNCSHGTFYADSKGQ
jgi:hypothetical protein